MTVATLLRMLKKYLILEMVIVVAFAAMGYWQSKNTPPTYRASARLMALYQSPQSGNRGDNGSFGSHDGSSSNGGTSYAEGGLLSSMSYMSQQLDVLQELVQTPQVLDPVIKELGLNATAGDLGGAVTVKHSDGSLMVDVSTSGTDPQYIVNLVNAVSKSLSKVMSQELGTTTKLEVVREASGARQIGPNVRGDTFRGAIEGLAVAFVVALALGFLDNKIRDGEDVKDITKSPILGTMPKDTSLDGSEAPVVASRPNGRVAEHVRRIATNLLFATKNDVKGANVIVVTSGMPSEGKTTVATNLAVAFAENGGKVLLIDADLRNPSVAKQLGVNGTVGLSQLLTGKASAQESIQQYWKPNLHLLCVGHRVSNPSLLVRSDLMKALIDQVEDQYDQVIIDTAPMQVANDAAVLGQQGGGVMLVVAQGKATRKSVSTVHNELKMVDVPIIGSVMNMTSLEKQKKSDYYYYAEDTQAGDQGADAGKRGLFGRFRKAGKTGDGEGSKVDRADDASGRDGAEPRVRRSTSHRRRA